ncbi:MAG: amidohydrolase [Crocinitomicaceae bacterium]|nr:amidohydrolase [Crocinitomicaceae bacterium]
MINQLLQKTEAIKEEVIAIRRHLHANPELSFQEFETAAFVSEKLKSWGISHQTNIAGTGIVGIIRCGKNNAKCIALRADMDALPIQELNECDYKSKKAGVMHACGHDVHTAMLLGAAKILQENFSELNVDVKLIFQPGEEKLPGGANLMIKEGVLENPKVEEIYALHVFPELEAGKVGLKSGMYMASCDELYFTVHGKGGHAAMPALNIDPIIAASKLILALKDIQEKLCPKEIPCVLAIGRIEGLGATNVIPDKVELQGTFRTMNEHWRTTAHKLIQEISRQISLETEANVEVKIEAGYPFLENNPDLTQRSKEILKQALGESNVIDLPIRMTGEDFAFFAQKVPAAFIRIGVRNEGKGIIHGVHNARFDIDENALMTGVNTFLSVCEIAQ